MLAWMLYVAMVTLLLSAAAFAAERTARLRRAPTRWIWILTIVTSLLLPTAIASVSIQIPNVFTPTVSQHLFALREATSQRLSPASWVKDSSGRVPEWRGLDPLLKQAWIAMSGGMSLILAVTGAHLLLRKRRWPKKTLHGSLVYVTPDIGPAVVGLLRPRIVVPAWVTQAPAAQQALVMAHEQSHLDARDPQLLTIALCLLVAMPWNAPLWWQLRRLRYAIEVDCDARVLSSGHDINSYGSALIDVGARQSGFIGSVAAMSESKSFLEERIRIMVLKPKKWAGVAALGLACLSLGIVTVAAQVGPPNAPLASGAERKEVAVNPAVLAGYAGSYKLGPGILRITYNGTQLLAQLTGQETFEIFPQSEKEFFYKVVDAQISFITDAQGRATSLVLHQHGANMPAPRLDGAAAQQLEQSLAEKIRFQQPNPASEAALRRMIEAISAGKPNYNEMSPELAKAVQQQLPTMQPSIAHMGAVKSLTFKGVGNQGWDIYTVQYENGVLPWRIMLDGNGIIVGALLERLP